MSGRTSALVALALLFAMGFAAPAWPQDAGAPCRLCDVGTATPTQKASAPVTLTVETSLDFGRLVIAGNGGGTAELTPDGGQSVAGSVASLGTRAMVGEVTIRGEPGRAVRIELPHRIEMFGRAGGTIHLDEIRSNLPNFPRLDGNGRLSFRFGGVLRVTGEMDGDFRGDLAIDVNYL